MAHGDTREGKWRGNWWIDWVASTLHTTSEHGLSSFTTADVHSSTTSNRLNWCPHRFKRTHPFHQKTKSGFWACAITFKTQSTWTRSLQIMLEWGRCLYEYSIQNVNNHWLMSILRTTHYYIILISQYCNFYAYQFFIYCRTVTFQ